MQKIKYSIKSLFKILDEREFLSAEIIEENDESMKICVYLGKKKM